MTPIVPTESTVTDLHTNIQASVAAQPGTEKVFCEAAAPMLMGLSYIHDNSKNFFVKLACQILTGVVQALQAKLCTA